MIMAIAATSCSSAAYPSAAAPSQVAPASPGGSAAAPAKSRTLIPFKWLFGFRIQAGTSLPIVIAKDLGYYADEGLDLTWDISTGQTSIRLIATNQYQAGSVSSPGTLIDYVQEGLPLRSVGLTSQKSNRVFIVRADSGIKRPKDLEGKTVGYKVAVWPEYLAMLAFDHVDRSKIKEVSVGTSSVELKQRSVDMLPGFRGNEPLVLKSQMGLDVNLLDPQDYGFPPLGTSLIVNTNYIKSHPDQVTGFLKATLKGEQFYLANKERTLAIAEKYADKDITPAQHEFLYDATVVEMNSGLAKTKGLGYQSAAQWQQQIDTLYQYGVIKAKPKVQDVFDNTALDRSLKDGQLVWP
mgnify:CR=1 FL=1